MCWCDNSILSCISVSEYIYEYVAIIFIILGLSLNQESL